MTTVILFGLASAVYPQLLAVVLVISTLGNARRLLWACCLASLTTAVVVNVAICAVFRSRGAIAGVRENALGPSAYLGVGVASLVLAAMLGSGRGRALLRRGSDRLPDPTAALRRGRRATGGISADEDNARIAAPAGGAAIGARARDPQPAPPTWQQRMEAKLQEGAMVIAAVTGALLAMPGPFDFLAMGRTARDGYGWIEALVLIGIFVAMKFLLIEVPSIAYLVNPEGTSRKVAALSQWMDDNRAHTIALFIAVIGAILVARGITGLL